MRRMLLKIAGILLAGTCCLGLGYLVDQRHARHGCSALAARVDVLEESDADHTQASDDLQLGLRDVRERVTEQAQLLAAINGKILLLAGRVGALEADYKMAVQALQSAQATVAKFADVKTALQGELAATQTTMTKLQTANSDLQAQLLRDEQLIESFRLQPKATGGKP